MCRLLTKVFSKHCLPLCSRSSEVFVFIVLLLLEITSKIIIPVIDMKTIASIIIPRFLSRMWSLNSTSSLSASHNFRFISRTLFNPIIPETTPHAHTPITMDTSNIVTNFEVAVRILESIFYLGGLPHFAAAKLTVLDFVSPNRLWWIETSKMLENDWKLYYISFNFIFFITCRRQKQNTINAQRIVQFNRLNASFAAASQNKRRQTEYTTQIKYWQRTLLYFHIDCFQANFRVERINAHWSIGMECLECW